MTPFSIWTKGRWCAALLPALWLLGMPRPAMSQPSPALDVVFARVDAGRERQVAFLRELIRAGERCDEAIQAVVARRFAALGCEVEELRVAPTTLLLDQEFASDAVMDAAPRLTVMARCPGTGGGRSLLLFGHPDGEPVRNGSWTRPAFDGVVEDGRIFGWGIADDLAGVAMMAEAMDAVRGSGMSLRGDVILGSTASKRNARGILAALRHGYSADGAVYLHPAESGGGLREVKALSSGLLRFRISVTGQGPETLEPSQTAFAHRGVAATGRAWHVITALQALDADRGRRVRHPVLEAQVGRSTNLLVANLSCGDPAATTRVPIVCTIAGSITFPPGEDMRAVQREVEETVRSAAKDDTHLRSHPPRLEWLFGTPGVEVRDDDPLWTTVSDAIGAVTGRAPIRYALHSGSDIRNPILLSGTPSVGFGPLAGGLTQAGFTDEWVDLGDYTRSVKALAGIIIGWAR